MQRAYQIQQQLPCEGCEENWASQDEHACMFYGVTPEYCVEDFVPLHYDNVQSSIDANEIISIFYAVRRLFDDETFIRTGLTKEALNDVIHDILMSWKNSTEDIAPSFRSYSFSNLNRLINYVMASLVLD